MNLKSFSLFLLAISSTISSASAKDPNHEIQDIAAPKLVECKTEQTCDRDPKHLEKFVLDFYKWNHSNENEFLTISNKNSDFIKKFSDNEQRVLTKFLTKNFYAWKNEILKYPPGDGPSNPRYCPSDINSITCSQDFADEWLSNAQTKIISYNHNEVDVKITFTPYYKIIVTLIPEAKIWKIDAVRNAK